MAHLGPSPMFYFTCLIGYTGALFCTGLFVVAALTEDSTGYHCGISWLMALLRWVGSG